MAQHTYLPTPEGICSVCGHGRGPHAATDAHDPFPDDGPPVAVRQVMENALDEAHQFLEMMVGYRRNCAAVDLDPHELVARTTAAAAVVIADQLERLQGAIERGQGK